MFNTSNDSGDVDSEDSDGMEMKFYSEVPGVLRSACQEEEDDGYMQFGFEQEDDREDMLEGDRQNSQSEDEQESPFIPPPPPCKRLIEYQQRILDYFNKDLYKDGKGPLTFNDRKQSRGGGEILAEDVIDLNLMRQVNVLSAKQADGVLKTFENILNRHNAHVPLPSSFREIDRRVFEDMKQVRQIKEFKYSYPVTFFGAELKDLVGKPLKLAAVGVCFDFCETIGHHLLNLKDNENFIREPDIQRHNGVRIYEDYTTSKHFENVTLALRRRTQNEKAIALAIGFTLDAAKLGKSTGSMCPLLVYIPNLVNDDYAMLFIGYVPIKFSYSKKVLIKLMQNQGCKSVSRCEEILQMIMRKIKLNFIYDALQQIIPLGNTGMELMLRDEKGATETLPFVFPILSLMTGDNEELHKLAGQTIKAKSSKKKLSKKICRICTSGDCIRDLDWGEESPMVRADSQMEKLGKLGEELMHRRFAGDYQLTVRDKMLLRHLAHWNVKPGFNPLYEFFYWQVSEKVLSFHLALVPDILHTVLKGLAEYAIHWSWDCISCLQKLDPDFCDNIVVFDERMTKFPYIQSFRFFPNCRFRAGVSNFMKASTKSSSGTAFSSGGIEAWKLQNLLLQMLFCIDGAIAPFTQQWSIDKRIQHGWNVGRTLVNALTSALEVIFVVKAAKLAENNLQSLQTMIATSRAHIMLLWCMRKDLLAAVTTKKAARKKASRGPIDLKAMEQDFFSGIKLHLLMHFVFYKQFYGADRRIIDTELSELFHKYVVNEVFETTSKNVVSVAKEMITSIQKRFHSLDLHKMVSKVKSRLPPLIVDATTEVNNEESHNREDDERKDPHDEDPYRVINNFGKEFVEFRDVINARGEVMRTAEGEVRKELKVVVEWKCSSNGHLHRRQKTDDAIAESNAVHPMVSLAFFGRLLMGTPLDGVQDMMMAIRNQSNPYLRLTLLKGLRLTALKEHGGDGNQFYIHADASYISDKKCDLRKEQSSVFSFVQVRLEDELAYGQVVAIIGVRDLRIKSCTETQKNANSKYVRLMVCVAFLEPDKKNAYKRDGLPFPRYEYEYVLDERTNRPTQQIWTQMFDATDVVLPAFIIGRNPKKWGIKQDAKYCKEAVFYCLPYERAVVPVTAALTDALEDAEDIDDVVILHGGRGGMAEVLKQLNDRATVEEEEIDAIDDGDSTVTDGDILNTESSENGDEY